MDKCDDYLMLILHPTFLQPADEKKVKPKAEAEVLLVESEPSKSVRSILKSTSASASGSASASASEPGATKSSFAQILSSKPKKVGPQFVESYNQFWLHKP